MDAIELFDANGKSTGLFACGKCRRIPQAAIGEPGAPNQFSRIGNCKEFADICCSPCVCEKCGAEFKPQYGRTDYCSICEDEKRQEECHQRHRKHLENAIDVTSEYDGPVLCEEFQQGDWGDFHSSLSVLIEQLEEEEEFYDEDGSLVWEGELWAFACTSRVSNLDIHDMIERLCDDGYEDMADHMTIPDSLKAGVKEFNEFNAAALTLWEVDYSRKVRVPLAAKTQ